MLDSSLKNDNQIYVEEVVLNRMIQIAKEAIEMPQTMTERYRHGYVLMALELWGIGVISEGFLDDFCRAVYPDYWVYIHGYAIE